MGVEEGMDQCPVRPLRQEQRAPTCPPEARVGPAGSKEAIRASWLRRVPEWPSAVSEYLPSACHR